MTKEMIVLENLRLDIVQRMKENYGMYDFLKEGEESKDRWWTRGNEDEAICRMIDEHLLRMRKEADL